MKILRSLFPASKSKEAVSESPDSIGLCLSGGGALGFAHIGIIKALEEYGIVPDHIAGSSMGAVVGSLYAAGLSATDMLQLVKDEKLYKITKLMTFRPVFYKSGLSSHRMLRSVIREIADHNSFEQLEKKLHVCVSNLNTAEWEIKESGNKLDKWVAASASIPGVFESIREGNVYYVDGGLLNNLPAQSISDYCNVIIGVDVLPYSVPTKMDRPTDTLTYSLRAVQHQNSKAGRDLCRMIIEPKSIERYHEFSYEAYQAIYQYGYDAAIQCFSENPGILKSCTETATK